MTDGTFDTIPATLGADDPFLVERAWEAASVAHGKQKVPGTNIPYLSHLALVQAEIALSLVAEPLPERESRILLAAAALHDSVEDTGLSPEQLSRIFGPEVASLVLAASKDKSLEKPLAMADSIRRILLLEPFNHRLKLADRIVNMRTPPEFWTMDKRIAYTGEAVIILDSLGPASPFLASRLSSKISSMALSQGFDDPLRRRPGSRP